MGRNIVRTLVVLALVAGGCKKKGEETPDVASLEVEGPTSLLLGTTGDLVATAALAEGGDSDVSGNASWSSSDEAVLTVADGVITTVGEGTATVTASYGGKSATLDVSVGTASVDGEVELHGWPVGEVLVYLDEDDSFEDESGRSDGEYEIEGVVAGTWTVVAELTRHRFDPKEEEIEATDVRGYGVDFEIVTGAYPSAEDGAGEDDEAALAKPIEVDGALLPRTIWPLGDRDWFVVELEAGVTYALFTAHLCETCDTEINLYREPPGGGPIEYWDNSDDYVDYDSTIIVTPAETGRWFLETFAHNPYGAGEHVVGVQTWVDDDSDSIGTWLDCDDGDAGVNPWMAEVPGNEVDEDCDGFLAPDPALADDDEPANSGVLGAVVLPLQQTSVEERWAWGYHEARYGRAISDTEDEDWWAIDVPARGRVWLVSEGGSAGAGGTFQVLDTDGVTVLETDPSAVDAYLTNSTDTTKRFFLRAVAGGPVWFTPIAIDLGVDRDQDGHYTQDWSGDRDCDDSDSFVGGGDCLAD